MHNYVPGRPNFSLTLCPWNLITRMTGEGMEATFSQPLAPSLYSRQRQRKAAEERERERDKLHVAA